MKNKYTCIVTGEVKYIAPSIAKNKIAKFGNEDEFRKHYVSPVTAKLLRQGQTVDEIRESLNITELPKVNPLILTRLNLLRKKKGIRGKEQTEKLERDRYLNSREYKDKMIAWAERQKNMSFQDWVETYTGTGRERGGTCVRPDIFLSWNNRACDGCVCYEFCMCYGKRLSHEKRKPRKPKKR
jgi:hypothetical protein